MTGDELLALIAQNPTDLATLSIYADHWEQLADLDRAQFLRTDMKLRTASPPMTDEQWALAEELRTLGNAIVEKDPEGGAKWLEAVSHPRVRATTWDGTSGTNEFRGRFLEDGALNYTQQSGTFQNGTWTQYGSLVFFEMNRHYADYTGVIVGGRLWGKAKNITRATWEWFLAPIDQPIEIPSDTNTNVYPWTSREAKPAKTATKKRVVKKAAKAAKPAGGKKAKPSKSAPSKSSKPTRSTPKSAKMNKPVKPSAKARTSTKPSPVKAAKAAKKSTKAKKR